MLILFVELAKVNWSIIVRIASIVTAYELKTSCISANTLDGSIRKVIMIRKFSNLIYYLFEKLCTISDRIEVVVTRHTCLSLPSIVYPF